MGRLMSIIFAVVFVVAVVCNASATGYQCTTTTSTKECPKCEPCEVCEECDECQECPAPSECPDCICRCPSYDCPDVTCPQPVCPQQVCECPDVTCPDPCNDDGGNLSGVYFFGGWAVAKAWDPTLTGGFFVIGEKEHFGWGLMCLAADSGQRYGCQVIGLAKW